MSINGQWWIQLKNKIKNFNLFQSRATSEEDLKNQHISTLIFGILLFLSIVILLLYSSLTLVTQTIVVQQPSLSVYNTLQQNYPDTLVCPCQQALIPYGTFVLSFKPTFNQICRSDFIATEWLNYVNYRPLTDSKYHLFYDFRHSAYSFFNMLNVLCQLISSTVNSQMIEFYSANLFTENVISTTVFNAVVNASGDQFLSTTANSFKTSLNSFKTIIQGNSIVNRLETNWILSHLVYNGVFYDAIVPVKYSADNNCSCDSTSQCKMTTGIYKVYRSNEIDLSDYWTATNRILQGQLEFEVEGIYVGCLILDAVLQSNLSCLYNISCLTHLYSYLHDSPYPINTSNITPLNVSSSSLSLATVQELINNLMVDEWSLILSFESYFNVCNSQSCTYTYTHRFDVIFIITTTVSFLGGIVTILMLTILPVVTFLRKSILTSRSERLTVAAVANNDYGK